MDPPTLKDKIRCGRKSKPPSSAYKADVLPSKLPWLPILGSVHKISKISDL
jgi:hypothetical protein